MCNFVTTLLADPIHLSCASISFKMGDCIRGRTDNSTRRIVTLRRMCVDGRVMLHEFGRDVKMRVCNHLRCDNSA